MNTVKSLIKLMFLTIAMLCLSCETEESFSKEGTSIKKGIVNKVAAKDIPALQEFVTNKMSENPQKSFEGAPIYRNSVWICSIRRYY